MDVEYLVETVTIETGPSQYSSFVISHNVLYIYIYICIILFSKLLIITFPRAFKLCSSHLT